jgi:predicted DsbA family dithiol-disulfide isomerase
VWLDKVKQSYGDRLEITWKNFQLEQVNNKEESDRKVWDLADQHEGRSLVAAMAGEAARRQGNEAFERFHLALLEARHGGGERIPLNQEDPIVKLAQKVGLDAGRFQENLKDRSLLDNIARDHTEAVDHHGAFGTPTFLFENGNATYLKSFIPPEEDSVAFFEQFVALAFHRSFVGEIKRPQPPWPKGAVS